MTRTLAVFALAIATVTPISGIPAHAMTVPSTADAATVTVTRAEFEQRLSTAQDDWINAHATEAVTVDVAVSRNKTSSEELSGIVNPDGTLFVTLTEIRGKAVPYIAQHLCAPIADGTVDCFYRAGYSKGAMLLDGMPWSPGGRDAKFTPTVLVDGATEVLGDDLADEPGINSGYAITVNPDGSSTYTIVFTGQEGTTVTASTTIGTVYSALVTGGAPGATPSTFYAATLTPTSPQAVPAAPTQLEPGSRTRSDMNALAKTLESYYTDKGFYPRTGRPFNTPRWDPNLDPNGIYRICYNRGEPVSYVILGTIPGANTYWVYDSANGGARDTADVKVNGKLPKCSAFDLPTDKWVNGEWVDGPDAPARRGPVLK